MKILFIHQNFPGQFKSLAPALAQAGHTVVAMTMRRPQVRQHEGIRLVPYQTARGSTPGIHPWVGDFEAKAIRGEAAFHAALQLRQDGYVPDIIIAHPGWGESLFLKEVWPRAQLGMYCEFFHHASGAEIGFDPEFTILDDADACRIRLKNINNLLHFQIAEAAISPTQWQASTFPDTFRHKISVIHDGIDTDFVRPSAAACLTLTTAQGRVTLDHNTELVTFVNRNLEPFRGYHVFMRSLPAILRSRPAARILLVGGNGVSYGPPPERGKTWKDIFAAELRGQVSDADWARVHFVGNLSYRHFVTALQLSTVHVYLTYPFVLSWSLLEAMSAGCAIVASATAPVQEVVTHGETGRLVNFFDHGALAEEICGLLADPAARRRLGHHAREKTRQQFDLRTICLPKQLAWAQALCG